MIQESPRLSMTSIRYKIWTLIQKIFPPTSEHLHDLSRHDRPGMNIQLPKSDLLLGREMLEQQNFQQALAYFEASILQNDDNAWAWHGKGDAHQWLGDYKESLNAYEQASARSPAEGLHWGGRANALYGLKEYTVAHDLRQRTLILNPTLQWMFSNWDDAQ